MMEEIVSLADAMNITFEGNPVESNLEILTTLEYNTTTSMQRDVMEGKQSEIDGLVYEVVRLGEQYHVAVPHYQRVADTLSNRIHG